MNGSNKSETSGWKKHLLKLQFKETNDEFYTLYESIKQVMEYNITDQLAGKIIYLPCDTVNSNIYKYLVDTKEKYKIKEIIRTDDDFRTHEDLFERADVVITNPPFSLKWQFYNMILKYNCNFIIYLHKMSLTTSNNNTKLLKHCIQGKVKIYKDFLTAKFTGPDGEYKWAECYIFSDLFKETTYINNDGSKRIFEFKKSFANIKHEYNTADYAYKDCLNVNRFYDIPYDYDKTMLVPPYFVMFNLDKFEVLTPAIIMPLINGKYKFARLAVKWKK